MVIGQLSLCVDVRESERPPALCEIVADDNGYPLGTDAYSTFIKNNIILDSADEYKRKGQCVLINVYIDTHGRGIKYKVFSHATDCEKCTTAALNVVKKIKRWKPGRKGYLVRVQI